MTIVKSFIDLARTFRAAVDRLSLHIEKVEEEPWANAIKTFFAQFSHPRQ